MSLTFMQSAVHNHTTLCDGQNTVEQMALAAWQQGVQVMGFSGHSHTPCDLEYCMSPGRTSRYKAEIGRLKKMYAGKMQILCGIEWDLFSDDDLEAYEYSIGSVHYIHGPKTGRYYEIDFRPQDLNECMENDFNGDGMAMAAAYFDNVKKTAAKCPTILGHFDLIKKLNGVGSYFNEESAAYTELAMDALKAASRSVQVLEINTGGVKRGYRSDFYPSPLLLKEWKALGGEVIITADCHDNQSILWGYNEAAKAAAEAGFGRVAVMNADGRFDFCNL